ncbi:MAG: ABC transporter permease [Bacteroidetes bacterium]|nr:ABC transporter permease [Bacteroidota bacterium]MCB9227533.1 ABC transporter permease [Chitinophagales bacterium]
MSQNSPNKVALKKFFKNRLAVLSFVFIVALSLLSIFAYIVSPDHTHGANEQFPKLAENKPGFSIKIVHLLNNEKDNSSFLKKIIGGYERNYTILPVDSINELTNEIIVYPYKGVKYSVGKDLLEKNKNSYVFNKTFYLGTDQLGRDILSRLILGSRVSLMVGFFAVILSSFIGIVAGGIAGYYRGLVDKIILWKMSVFWSIPTILLAMSLFVGLKSYFKSNMWLIFIAIGITMWVSMARIVRGQVLAYKNIQFVEAAKSLSYSDFRIIFKHILPNLVGPIVVVMASNFANAILVESGLSFLGMGVQAPMPSWGGMLSEYKNFIGTNLSFLAVVPGVAIMLLVLSFNLVGNGIRDALDIKNT